MQTITLTPSYRLPLAILLLAGALSLIQPWGSGVVAVLGLFLFFQAWTIRLEFRPTALAVLRRTTVLVQFPYQDWQAWTVYWSWLPILFYFREVKSIHFLPVLFQRTELVEQLQRHCPELELP